MLYFCSMKKITTFALLLFFSLLFAACSQTTTPDLSFSETSEGSTTTEADTNAKTKSLLPSEEGPMKKLEDFEKIDAKTAVISTTKGDIEVELYPEMAPVTVASFLDLAKKKFYDGIVVHRVEPGFVIQVGDPKTKDSSIPKTEYGTGGPGYTIPDEFSQTYKYDKAGILAMAKTMAPNSGGSQFFITLDAAPHLNGSYTVFGVVTKGLDVVKSIQVGDSIKTVTYK